MLAFYLLYFPYIFKKDIFCILLHNTIKLIWLEEVKTKQGIEVVSNPEIYHYSQ